MFTGDLHCVFYLLCSVSSATLLASINHSANDHLHLQKYLGIVINDSLMYCDGVDSIRCIKLKSV